MTDRRFLDVLDVKDPCTESWEAMSGDGPVRFCGMCRMNVYNLSAMRSEEAEALAREREGRLCVRFYRRADGTVVTTDCAPIRLAAARRAARRTMAGAAALFLALLGLVTGLGLFRLFGSGGSPVIASISESARKLVQPDIEMYPMMGEAPMVEEFPVPVEPGGEDDLPLE